MSDEGEGRGPRAEPPGVRRFEAAEMVSCDGCMRANPPTRMNCLYCGLRLPVTELSGEHLRPALRRLEEWEHGHNVVLLPPEGRGLPQDKAEELARFLRLDPSRFESVLAARVPLPLARAETAEEAALIEERLGANDLRTLVVTDEELGADRPPLRARSFDLSGGRLVAHTGAAGELRSFHWAEVSLLVAGRVFSRRFEVEERGALPGSRGELIGSRELSADEAVLDVYAAGDRVGVRVLCGSFDYACLGPGMGLLAVANFAALTGMLRARAHAAVYDDTYAGVRHLLATAWPPAERNESGGLRRDRPGRFNTEVVTVVSNAEQFTRYSRLRRHLALKGLTGSS